MGKSVEMEPNRRNEKIGGFLRRRNIRTIRRKSGIYFFYGIGKFVETEPNRRKRILIGGIRKPIIFRPRKKLKVGGILALFGGNAYYLAEFEFGGKLRE
jgi:hypothetical protein